MEEKSASSPAKREECISEEQNEALTPVPNESNKSSKLEDGSEGTPAPGSVSSWASSYSQRNQEGKVFIGGLSWETTDIKLKQYFENFGTVQEAYVSYDRHTGRPRGFGFVVFADPCIADKVVSQQHTIDRREVEAKKALPKEESPVSKDMQAAASGQRTKKIFVGGLAGTVDEPTFREYFEKFGKVEDAVVMYDQHNRRPRGFGFITFAEEEAVEAVFAKGVIQTIHEKEIEIKRAIPRDSGVLPSPKTLYRSPQDRHYGFRTPGSATGKGHGFRPDYAHMGAHMMGMHPIRGIDGGPNPMSNETMGMTQGVVTGIPANMIGNVAQDPTTGAYLVDPQTGATMGQVGALPHMMAQGLPQATPPNMRDPYTLPGQNVDASPSFPVEAQRLGVGGVQDTISLVSVSEALEQLSHSPGQVGIAQQQQSQQSPGPSQPGQDTGGGALWN